MIIYDELDNHEIVMVDNCIFHDVTADKFYFSRTSRDLKRIDIGVVDVKTATAKTLIQEQMNTYVEIRRIGLVS